MATSSDGTNDSQVESWELKLEDRLVGTLIFEAQDMFWSDCRFRPGPAWEDFRPLNDRSREAWRRGDREEARTADDAIMTSGLVLVPLKGGAPITPVMVRVDGDTARFRF
ncbi:hypothetical protein V1227_29860 [Lentzea sp. DG1S-22]|uniref:hypothetical protein n=1 Tax=Lentzea sp. DG1S-22 TaxID=3108822 RepID=UPI002E76DDB4|nr:hypothetical protein [Lentzea sp. DG1S-22]WVH79219.1 hypothetical protein V1227_29860 [Lentzea sp. DG1S-22]